MSDAPPKRANSSSSKPRKSRNEIIRSTLGMYLKQRNYSPSEKFRKSELTLTQTVKQAEFNMMMDDDVSKVNSFLYSNVMCLNNNPGIVDQQFAKFLLFVRSQPVDIKQDLQSFVCPLICHLFVELLKGKDPQPAHDFLRKFAPLIGPVDNSSSSSTTSNPIPNLASCNSNGIAGDVAKPLNGTASSDPASTSSSSIGGGALATQPLITFLPEPENANTVKKHFMALVEALSLCQRPEDVDTAEVTRLFRYAQHELRVHWATVVALKRHLIGCGHVMIMHTLQTWFSLDIFDGDAANAELAAGEVETETVPPTQMLPPSAQRHGHGAKSTTAARTMAMPAIRRPRPSATKAVRTAKATVVVVPARRKKSARPARIKAVSAAVKVSNKAGARKSGATTETSHDRLVLQHLRLSVERVRAHARPMRVLSVNNADRQFATADIDPQQCHLACGFDDSTVRLWPLHQSIYRGRKPYGNLIRRSCAWSLEHGACDLSFSDTDESSEDEADAADRWQRARRRGQKRTAAVTATVDDDSLQMDGDHTFDSGVHILRGHSAGVTAVHFSRHQPRLLYSVSKDRHMRAWLANRYDCAAVYRGHSYAVWCMAESSVGTFLATGSKDLTARLWSSEREFPLQTYVGHTQDVDTIAFHPNGNYLATGSTDQTVRLWCVTSGKLFRVFHDCHLPVQCVAFSPDGKLLAAAGEETKIRIFDLAAGSQLAELRDHSAAVTTMSWSPAGDRLVSGCADGTVRVFEVAHLANPKAVQQSIVAAAAAAVPPSSTSTSTSKSGNAPPNASSSSSSSNHLKPASMIDSGCERCVRTYFAHGNGAITCVGSAR